MQLVASEQFIEWNRKGGLRTGITQRPETHEISLLEPDAEQMIPDAEPNGNRIRLAIDVMMALQSDDSKDVLPTLTETSWDYASGRDSTDET